MREITCDLPDVNRVVISGELINDPPLRTTRRGVPVTNFTIVSTRYEMQEDGKSREERNYIRVVAWSSLAEHCYRLLRRGNSVVMIGELQSASIPSQSPNDTFIQVNAKWIHFPPYQPGRVDTSEPAEEEIVESAGSTDNS